MRSIWCLALALAALAVTPAGGAPLAAYGSLPSIETAALSGDGAKVALLASDGERRMLVIRNVGESKNTLTVMAGQAKVRDLRWVGDDHLLVSISMTASLPDVIVRRSEWVEVLDINLKARTQTNLLGAAQNTIRAAIATPQIRFVGGQPVAFLEAYHFVDDVGRVSLYRIDLTTGLLQLVAIGKPETDEWLVGGDGQPVAESRYDAKAARRSLLVRRGNDWRVADTGASSFGDDSILGLGRDGRAVMLYEAGGDGAPTVRELAPGAADWSAPVPTPDNQELIFDSTDERLIGTHALVGDADVYRFFAPADQAMWDAAAKVFPGDRVTFVSVASDHAKVLAQIDSPTAGPSFAVVDAVTHVVTSVGAAYANLTADDLAQVRPISFTAKDGTALTGYLTLPRGRDLKALPLVVFPHGGPASRDEPGFDWWAQAMASHGYAVLQVNYRGSDGFGWGFMSAGFGEWGRKMQTDLSDGVRYLVAEGAVDAKRVCIVGGSYGGYAALAGATLDPGVYRCAVSVAGLSDLRRFVAWSKDQSDVVSQRYWDRFMGAKDPDDPRLAEISPASHVDAATPPILLVHGKDDTVVPFEQSQIMADALKKAGHPVDLVVLSHEDHWLSHGDTRLQMLEATMDFLRKNNPAD